jgi:hypothetical protein
MLPQGAANIRRIIFFPNFQISGIIPVAIHPPVQTASENDTEGRIAL